MWSTQIEIRIDFRMEFNPHGSEERRDFGSFGGDWRIETDADTPPEEKTAEEQLEPEEEEAEEKEEAKEEAKEGEKEGEKDGEKEAEEEAEKEVVQECRIAGRHPHTGPFSTCFFFLPFQLCSRRINIFTLTTALTIDN